MKISGSGSGWNWFEIDSYLILISSLIFILEQNLQLWRGQLTNHSTFRISEGGAFSKSVCLSQTGERGAVIMQNMFKKCVQA